MTQEPQPPPPQPPPPAKLAFVELLEKRSLLARQGESIRAQIRAVEDSLKALKPHSLGDLIRLEFTKDEAGVLASVCYHFVARCPGIGDEMCDLINRLGDDLIQAMRDQNADFAERANRILYGRTPTEPADECAPSPEPEAEPKDCPSIFSCSISLLHLSQLKMCLLLTEPVKRSPAPRVQASPTCRERKKNPNIQHIFFFRLLRATLYNLCLVLVRCKLLLGRTFGT